MYWDRLEGKLWGMGSGWESIHAIKITTYYNAGHQVSCVRLLNIGLPVGETFFFYDKPHSLYAHTHTPLREREYENKMFKDKKISINIWKMKSSNWFFKNRSRCNLTVTTWGVSMSNWKICPLRIPEKPKALETYSTLEGGGEDRNKKPILHRMWRWLSLSSLPLTPHTDKMFLLLGNCQRSTSLKVIRDFS